MPVHLTRRTIMTLIGAGAVSLATPLAAQDDALRLAFIPQENPEKLLGDIEAITGWLASEIGVPVEGFVTIDHAAAVEALGRQALHARLLGFDHPITGELLRFESDMPPDLADLTRILGTSGNTG